MCSQCISEVRYCVRGHFVLGVILFQGMLQLRVIESAFQYGLLNGQNVIDYNRLRLLIRLQSITVTDYDNPNPEFYHWDRSNMYSVQDVRVLRDCCHSWWDF